MVSIGARSTVAVGFHVMTLSSQVVKRPTAKCPFLSPLRSNYLLLPMQIYTTHLHLFARPLSVLFRKAIICWCSQSGDRATMCQLSVPESRFVPRRSAPPTCTPQASTKHKLHLSVPGSASSP